MEHKMIDPKELLLSPQCPICGERRVTEIWEDQTFSFGAHPSTELVARVPSLNCEACGFSHTDERAEAIRHDAACRFQGLITPSELKHLRTEVYGLSRKQFEAAFGVGEASLERWENRKLFPNKQISNFLRLLMDPANGRRVMHWGAHLERKPLPFDQSSAPSASDKFRALRISPEIETRARAFRLHSREMLASV